MGNVTRSLPQRAVLVTFRTASRGCSILGVGRSSTVTCPTSLKMTARIVAGLEEAILDACERSWSADSSHKRGRVEQNF